MLIASEYPRLHADCVRVHADCLPPQVALAKIGGIPLLVQWLAGPAINVQAQAAQALLCTVIENPMTQVLVAKCQGIAPLIKLIQRSSPQAQDCAARAMFHIASIVDNQTLIADAGAIKPFVQMIIGNEKLTPKENETPQELAAINLVRLTRGTPAISEAIAERGGIKPLVRLLNEGSPGAIYWACACLAELALVPKNRDLIAAAGGIKRLSELLISPAMGTPEIAARTISHLVIADHEGTARHDAEDSSTHHGAELGTDSLVGGSDERRKMFHEEKGTKRLISMLDGSNLHGLQCFMIRPIGLACEKCEIGMQEQAAAAMADLAYKSSAMQDAIIALGGIASLIQFIRQVPPSKVGQEHAVRPRPVLDLSQQIENL